MHLQRALPAACLLACLLALPHSIQAKRLCGANIINLAGGQDQKSQDIIIQDNKIVGIEDASNAPCNAEDDFPATDMFCMPGLVENHAHLCFSDDPAQCMDSMKSVLLALISNGVTSVQDLGSNCNAVKQAKDDIEKNGLPLPRIHTTCEMLDGKNSLFLKDGKKTGPIQVLEDPALAETAVRNLVQQDVNKIKVHLALSRPVFQRVSEVCRRFNIQVGGHVPDSMTASQALDDGMNFIEHKSAINFTDQDVVDKIGKKGLSVSCTLIQSPTPENLKLCNDLRIAKANVLCGTDTPAGKGLCPDGATHKELQLLVKAGFDPRQALQTATTNGYKSLNTGSEFGIERGKTADMVCLTANPAKDIRNMDRKNIGYVVINGQVLDSGKLNQMLQSADVKNKLAFACGGDIRKASLQSRATCCSH
ncbi:amidohydrolase family protein [Hirsutella rhossiliensis]|uniref:Amidohydrolase family domain-containing protein n=1 Tax=Hirsutella rhossiliensis TaxID=111463 RepID=A0A9P8N0P4_9HYPO|nr:amidohydrolase family domain-containing protein [Hirsutella rhossiliensis]KAH0964750.1 amidohydrolase family domain-containing protein [Hirsutella rhossiliensis]